MIYALGSQETLASRKTSFINFPELNFWGLTSMGLQESQITKRRVVVILIHLLNAESR
jgi:hypothetical protein